MNAAEFGEPAVLEVEGLSVGIESRTLFELPALRVEAGQLLAVRGPSGSGKTTLLRTLAGLMDPLAGEVRLLGQSGDQQGWPRFRSRMPLVPQEPVLAERTVEANLARPLRFASAGRRELPRTRAAECVGIHAAERGTRFEALEPIRQGVREHLGAFGEGVAESLSLRHDHGSQYTSDDFQHELRFLGIESAPSFVREPEGNGCADRFIRTLKENLLWVRTFQTVEELRQALIEFKHRYNNNRIIERHDYRTPAQVRRDKQGLSHEAA